MRAQAAALALGIAVACVPSRPFRCDDDEQCVNGEARGVCGDAGFCAYADGTCDSELRYESNAGDGLGGTCLEYEPIALDCGEYCALGADVCDGWPSFTGLEDGHCESTCERLPLEGEHDSLECRYGWLILLEEPGDPVACWSASLGGGDDCVFADGPSCDLFCAEHAGLCGEGLVFGAFDCDDACSRIRPGELEDLAGDTLGCRLRVLEDTTLTVDERCELAAPEESTACADDPE